MVSQHEPVVFIVVDEGDPSVGIWACETRVTFDPGTIFRNRDGTLDVKALYELKDYLSSLYDITGGGVWELSEYGRMQFEMGEAFKPLD